MGESRSIVELLATRAERSPIQTFASFRDRGELSYATAWQQSLTVGARLQQLGVARGDAVAMLLFNRPEAVTMWFGCAVIGAVDAQLNWQLRGGMLARQVRDTGAQVLVVESELAPVVLAVADALSQVRVIATVGPEVDRPASSSIELVAFGDVDTPDAAPAIVAGDGAAISTIVYTGGTTGASKGCAISNAYALSAAQRYARLTALGDDETTWTPLPLYHVNAKLTTVMATLVRGARAAFSDKFSVTNFWRDVGEARATRARIISTMIPLIADGPEPATAAWTDTLRQVIGSPVSVEVAARFRQRWGVTAWSPGYGLTEVLWATGPDRPGQPVTPGTMGRVDDDMEVRLVDEQGDEVPVGVAGEIMIRPKRPGLMFSGYWRNPAATWDACRDLWFATGDMARVDPSGQYVYVDRKKDSIRRKGENVACAEVEETMRGHVDIDDVAIVGVPSELSEEDVLAWVVSRPGVSITAEDVHRWCADNVPRYAMPRYVRVVDGLPRQEFGRVQKNVIRAAGVAGAWDSESSAPASGELARGTQ